MKYGVEPEIVAECELEPSEFQYYVYLPIKMNDGPTVRVPQNLMWLTELLGFVEYDDDDYVYLTVKHMIHQAGCPVNRPGWHSDGFGTDDVNYVWYDGHPTEFFIGDFGDVPSDDFESMFYFDQFILHNYQIPQKPIGEIKNYPSKSLIRMDQYVIHRVSEKPFTGTRCFVKISVSKNKYDLQGNSHNYLFNYDWDMKPREVTRNQPSSEE